MKAQAREVILMPLIEAENLVKVFKVAKRKQGLTGAVINLFHPEYMIIRAVDGISFTIDKGEIVGFIGPNGAGKSTTIKMMCGILNPTSGWVKINGLSPQKNRKAVVSKLGVVFGQRTQLYWDLRLGESFELAKRIYKVDNEVYNMNLKAMDDILKIGELIDIPVRQLSLGQRMRGELAMAMIHSPSVLFLDEPSIGLDAEAKYAVREFIKSINEKMGTTVILTTHDLNEVEQLCRRLIVLNKGRIIEDASLSVITDKIISRRILIIDLDEDVNDIDHPAAQVIKKEGLRVWMQFQRSKITAAQLVSDLSRKLKIRDISIQEPDIEEVIREVYKGTAQ